MARMTDHTLVLVDGSSYLYRAYHALPDLRAPMASHRGGARHGGHDALVPNAIRRHTQPAC
jgi:5'-3' exonuclease